MGGVSVDVFPNPAAETINISSENKLELIILLAQDGQEIDRFSNLSYPSVELDISALSSGIYYLNMIFRDQVAVRKFIKK